MSVIILARFPQRIVCVLCKLRACDIFFSFSKIFEIVYLLRGSPTGFFFYNDIIFLRMFCLRLSTALPLLMVYNFNGIVSYKNGRFMKLRIRISYCQTYSTLKTQTFMPCSILNTPFQNISVSGASYFMTKHVCEFSRIYCSS